MLADDLEAFPGAIGARSWSGLSVLHFRLAVVILTMFEHRHELTYFLLPTHEVEAVEAVEADSVSFSLCFLPLPSLPGCLLAIRFDNVLGWIALGIVLSRT